MTHTKCGAQLLVATRTVQTMPEDRSWPRDRELGLPYCPECKTIVSVTEVIREKVKA